MGGGSVRVLSHNIETGSNRPWEPRKSAAKGDTSPVKLGRTIDSVQDMYRTYTNLCKSL